MAVAGRRASLWRRRCRGAGGGRGGVCDGEGEDAEARRRGRVWRRRRRRGVEGGGLGGSGGEPGPAISAAEGPSPGTDDGACGGFSGWVYARRGAGGNNFVQFSIFLDQFLLYDAK